MVRVIEEKIIDNDLRGDENWFELAGVRVQWRVRVTEGKITVNV